MDIPVKLSLVPENAPILRTGYFDDVSFDDLEFLYSLSHKMYEFMLENNGVGLAAPQVGIPLNIFVIGGVVPRRTFVNPRIMTVGSKTLTMEEGCLSFPNYKANIERPESIVVSYYNINGDAIYNKFSDMNARIIQHEYDHLVGRVIKPAETES